MTQLLEEAADTAAAGTAPILFVGDETVVADGALGSWAAPCDAAWADEVVASLGAGERAIGALSFAPGGPAIMHRVAGSGRPPTPVARDAERRHVVTPSPTREQYAGGVRDALARIAAGRLEKVVLGRCARRLHRPQPDHGLERPGQHGPALLRSRLPPARCRHQLPALGAR